MLLKKGSTRPVDIAPESVLGRLGSYIATVEVILPDDTPLLVASVHARPAAAAPWLLRGLDADALRRPPNADVYWSDVVFAGYVDVVRGRRFIVGGDWNNARYCDADGTPSAAGQAFFDRAAAAGWMDVHQSRVGHEERSWYGSTNPRPYQPDHVFTDPGTAELARAARIDAYPVEVLKLSDHAPLVVDLDLPSHVSAAEHGGGRSALPPSVQLESSG